MFNVGGGYYYPSREELLLDDKWYRPDNGLILVNPLYPKDIPHTLAHEWRHHWQRFHGIPYDGIPFTGDNYRDYYMRSQSEGDALRFALRYAPIDEGAADLIFS